MDEAIIIKREAVRLVRNRLKELLKPLGFKPHPRVKNRLMRVREELIDEVNLRQDGYHLEPRFCMYYRKAPFAGLHLDNGSLWRVMKEREDISADLRWDVEFPKGELRYYHYKTEHFEKVWQEVKLALEYYILPYMNAMSVEKLLSLMVRGSTLDEDFFEPHRTVFFSDMYFSCMSEAAVYGVGMWILEKYTEGLPYIIFAQNKYREWMRPYEQETEHFYKRHGCTLEVMDTLIDIHERKPWELKSTIQHLTDMVSTNWMDYMM